MVCISPPFYNSLVHVHTSQMIMQLIAVLNQGRKEKEMAESAVSTPPVPKPRTGRPTPTPPTPTLSPPVPTLSPPAPAEHTDR